MAPKMKTLPLISLILGLGSIGALALAVATDYWLFSVEPITTDMLLNMLPNEGGDAGGDQVKEETQQGLGDVFIGENVTVVMPQHVNLHSGLWRVCIFFEDEGAIRASSPVIVVSLLLLIAAFALSTMGNAKHNSKTVVGAVFYVIAGLTLALGVITYISAVNDEVAHRKKPEPGDPIGFNYHYGSLVIRHRPFLFILTNSWAFFFAAASFMCALSAAVINITLFVKRFPNVEDMALIVPGLEKPAIGGIEVTNTIEDVESHSGTNNPTIIF